MRTLPILPHAFVVPARPSRGRMLVLGLAVVLLAASGYRHQGPGAALSWLSLAALPLVGGRRAYSWRMLAAGLALGAWQWLWLGRDLVLSRLAFDQPYLRLALILGAVAGLTLWAGVLALHQAGRARAADGPAARAEGACEASAWIAAGLLLALAVFPSKTLLLGSRFLPGLSLGQAALMGCAAGRVCGWLLAPDAAGWRLRLWLAFSGWFFAQLVLGLVLDSRFLMSGTLHVPVPAVILGGPVFRGGGYFMLGLFAVSVLLAGPAWCSHLCYFGALDSWLARRRKKPSTGLAVRGRLRLWALLATLATALGLRLAGADAWIAAGAGLAFGAVGMLAFGPASVRQGVSLHCLTWCPMGLLASWLGRLSPWRLRVASGCSSCGRCGRACRHAALEEADLAQGRAGPSCTLCGDCLSVCGQALTRLTFAGRSGDWVLPAHKAVLAVLWTVFFAVARV